MHHFDEQARSIADLVLAYTSERLTLDPVPLDDTVAHNTLSERVGALIGTEGRDPAEVFRIFCDELAPAVISCDSPRYLSFIPAAPTKAALMFDMVVSASSLSGISWLESAGAIYAENQALRVIADAAGLPAGAGGVFVSGGSAGNLSALVVARETARARAAAEDRNPPRRWRVVTSDQSHSSIANTCRIIDAEPLIVTTPDGRLSAAAVRAALASDGDPQSVCAVVATAGTTNAGIVDDLDGVADVAGEHGWWFHVDGAYGAAALFAPSARPRFRGIERCDSMIVDPHKWLFAPFDSCALVYRDPARARPVHTQDASYLDVIHEHPEEWNPSDYAYHLTRRARGLPLWFSLAVHGTDAYRDAIEASLTLARRAAQRITDDPVLELVREPELSVVLFRRCGWEPTDYASWSQQLLHDQIAFVTPTKWRGETVARFAFLHPGTTLGIVDEIIATMH